MFAGLHGETQIPPQEAENRDWNATERDKFISHH